MNNLVVCCLSSLRERSLSLRLGLEELDSVIDIYISLSPSIQILGLNQIIGDIEISIRKKIAEGKEKERGRDFILELIGNTLRRVY